MCTTNTLVWEILVNPSQLLKVQEPQQIKRTPGNHDNTNFIKFKNHQNHLKQV